MKKKDRIGQILLKKGTLTEDELSQCLAQSKLFHKRIGQMAVELGFATDAEITDALSEHTGLPVVSIANIDIAENILQLLPHPYCKKHRLVPFHLEGKILFVVMNDPLDIQALDDISLLWNYQVSPALCTPQELKTLLDRQIKKTTISPNTVQSLVNDINVDMAEDPLTKASPEDIEKLANNAPIVKLVNLIIEQAITRQASDIHMEHYEGAIIVRYRIDGILYDEDSPPANLYPLIISRLKLMAGMNIAERRLPQDGRVSFDFKGKNIDLRVSTLPSINGEGIVLRILDKNEKLFNIIEMGLTGRIEKDFVKLIQKPHGIVLVTGPTGSGKTTTLYAALSHIKSPEKKIITLEDPVEYQLDRINQLNINPSIGFTFATGLRHILRQDPDIMMVGEIRDNETAEVAIRSALTGHLVFSTLHTNDSISAITRLTNMSIEPYLVASTVAGVMAQRLVRSICPHCKEEKQFSPDEIFKLAGVHMPSLEAITLYEGRGCEHCYQSGYQGRTGIFELFILSDAIKEAIIAGATPGDLRVDARKNGMQTLREHGLEKVKQGATTIAEILRVTQNEMDDL